MTNPYAPPRAAVLDVVDPLALSTPADRGTRFGAAMLDGIIFAGMVYVPLLVAVGLGSAVEDGDGAVDAMAIGGFIATFIGLIAWIWLTVKYVAANGQSIGKKLVGIKVVRSDGAPATLGRIFWLRNVVNGLIGIIPLYALVDHLFIFGETRQCLHDKIADTVVVRA